MTSASTSSDKTTKQPATGDNITPKDGDVQASLELNSLPERVPPSLTAGYYLRGHEPGQGEGCIIVSQKALQQIAAHSISNLRVELGGTLLGQAYRHKGNIYVEVLAALPAVNRDHGPVHFTFTADSWAQLQKDHAAYYADLMVVGWFHTHPGLGVFYSGDDVVVHSSSFTLPWQIGLVVDPVSNESCFFGWGQGQLKPFSGYYESLDIQEKPVVKWKVVRTAVWHHDQGYDDYISEQERATGRVYVPANQRPTLSPAGSGWGLIVGALALLLSFFLLVGWVIPLTQQVGHLESVVLTLTDEGLRSSNVAVCPDSRLRILTPVIGDSVPVGSTVQVVGTADHPDTNRYRVEVRLAESEHEWIHMRTQRRRTSLNQLAAWDTTPYEPQWYDIRLTAVDRDNIPLTGINQCIITIELTPDTVN